MRGWILWGLLAMNGSVTAAPHIEFLWEPAAPGSNVRPQAMVIVTEAADQARVCWKSMALKPGEHQAEWQVRDANDEPVATLSHTVNDDARPIVSCTTMPEAGEDVAFGRWTFQVVVDGRHLGERSFEVVESFEDWSFYERGYMPYVRGRTNYRPENGDQYTGSFLMELTVAADGSVSDVRLVESHGSTPLAEELVLESGRVFRFLPDPARAEEPLRVRQRVNLEPGH